MTRRYPLASLLLLLLLAAGASPSAAEEVQWIWFGSSNENQTVWLRREFNAPEKLKSAQLAATCDNRFTLYLNGAQVLKGDDWNRLNTADLLKQLRPGKNVLAVEARNEGGPAGFIAAVQLVEENGKKLQIGTDASWRGAAAAAENWQAPEFEAAGWKAASVLGPVGSPNLPWSGSISAADFGGELTPLTGGARPTAAPGVKALPGFEVEKLFHVPKSMGSWVSLTVDPQGRLIASDQGGAGLYLITPAPLGESEAETKVEKLPVNLSGAQGLVWAFDSLYAMVNGGKAGLHKLTDSDGDGLVDTAEHLMHVPGGGEHGPHAVILSPDGQSLYVGAGNHTGLPEGAKSGRSRVPRNWGEDLLLPRRWDANGHAAGRLAPGGWICQVDPQGKQWEIVSIGYRNQYDHAFNADGELFTYDADMEWDLGSPWYRPTRICHAVSGSEFGWRSGTGKWPVYYEDSLPPTVDIGPGSPVGVVFGYGAKFPAKYQNALYALDWTYGTIHAVHLTPEGASYRGEREDFLYGVPLPVTDAIVGRDGALYFTVGGRGTQSALYRVRYTGEESTAPAEARDSAGAELRALRRKLEQWHGKEGAELPFLLANLGHEDRFIRYAARVALESQPVESWRESVSALREPRAVINGAMALARQGVAEDLPAILESLGRLHLPQLETQQQLALLRAYQLAFIRLGEPAEEARRALAERLDAHYPHEVEPVSAELVQLLVYLRSPAVVAKTLAYMQSLGPEPTPDLGLLAARNAGYGGTVNKVLQNPPPIRGIHYAFTLRNVAEPWTAEERRAYFGFFLLASRSPGGSSYGKFLEQIRAEALEKVPQGERPEIASRPLGPAPVKVTPPAGPGRKWDQAAALASLGSELRGRDFDRGRNLFHATQCAKCHRYNAEGGSIGPDLSTVGHKFSLPDLLDSLIEPSKTISDQYGSHQVAAADGRVAVGRVVEVGEELHVYTSDPDAKPVVIRRDEVEEMVPSPVSQMPAGLLDVLNEEELRDLIAYLLSAGNRGAPYFGK